MAATTKPRQNRADRTLAHLDPDHVRQGTALLGDSRQANEFADTVRRSVGAKFRNLSATLRRDLTDDAVNIGLLVGVAMLGDPRHADETTRTVAHRAAWDACQIVLADWRAGQRALPIPAGHGSDLDSLTADRAAPAVTATQRPDWQALPETDRERVEATRDRLTPATLATLAAALTLPTDRRSWQTGRPGTSAMLTVLGQPGHARARGRMAARISAALAETRETIARDDSHRAAATDLTAHYGTFKRTPAAPHYPGRQSHATARRQATDGIRSGAYLLALAAALRQTYPLTPGMLGTPRLMPESGPATPVVVTTKDGGTFVLVTETADGEPTTRRYPLTDRQAEAILAGPTGRPYRPTAADRDADAVAYTSTPGGPVRAPAPSRKSRAAGAVGTSMVGRAPRLDWGSRTDRRDPGRPSDGRWDAHTEHTAPYSTLRPAAPLHRDRAADHDTVARWADRIATLSAAIARPASAPPATAYAAPIGPPRDPYAATCHQHGAHRRYCTGRAH